MIEVLLKENIHCQSVVVYDEEEFSVFEVGDIVKVLPEWLNPSESGRERYIVTNVNEAMQRCSIQSLTTKAPFPCIETVGFNMIEMVASERFVYAVCFHRKDGNPVEEYEYHNKDEAIKHFDLFRDDDSGLYSQIVLTETRIGLPEVILERLDFKRIRDGEKTVAKKILDAAVVCEGLYNNKIYKTDNEFGRE